MLFSDLLFFKGIDVFAVFCNIISRFSFIGLGNIAAHVCTSNEN